MAMVSGKTVQQGLAERMQPQPKFQNRTATQTARVASANRAPARPQTRSAQPGQSRMVNAPGRPQMANTGGRRPVLPQYQPPGRPVTRSPVQSQPMRPQGGSYMGTTQPGGYSGYAGAAQPVTPQQPPLMSSRTAPPGYNPYANRPGAGWAVNPNGSTSPYAEQPRPPYQPQPGYSQIQPGQNVPTQSAPTAAQYAQSGNAPSFVTQPQPVPPQYQTPPRPQGYPQQGYQQQGYPQQSWQPPPPQGYQQPQVAQNAWNTGGQPAWMNPNPYRR